VSRFKEPDERYDFPGWRIERFNDRCYFQFLDVSITGARAARYEITQDDFQSAVAGKLDQYGLQRKYDHRGLVRFLHEPGPALKVTLIATFIFALAATIYIYSGLL
jgi:hypothetical protein